MTYKLEMLLVIQKKRLIYIKSFKNYIFLWCIYIGLLVFYTKLTHLAKKLKKLRLDTAHDAKLNCN